MSRWNQPICERDWISQRGKWEPGADPFSERLVSVEMPIGLTREHVQVERCSWCGQPTIFGVYVRADPASVPFPPDPATSEEGT